MLRRTLNLLEVTGGVGQKKIKVPEPKHYNGARDAKELENFLFDIEQYFDATEPPSEKAEVATAAMYLSGDAKLWWRSRYADIRAGVCQIDTWEDL